jgi:cysteine synthase B
MNVLHLAGNTPLVELPNCSPKPGIRLFAKLEGQNTTGSVKVRIVAYMLERAKSDGRLAPGQALVKATAGNTGIALLMTGRRLGHPVRLVVATTAYNDVTQALKAWEPQIEWFAPDRGIMMAIAEAHRIAEEDGAFLLDQFGSPDNPRCHYETTGVEVLRDAPDLDVFVCGLGTSGTAMGVGRRLKEHNPDIQLVVAEPHPGHTLQGIRSLDDGYNPCSWDL